MAGSTNEKRASSTRTPAVFAPTARVPGRLVLVHAFHAAAVTAACWRGCLGLGDFRDHGFRGQHEAGDRRCVLQRGAHYVL
jgi:hypothetical protein